MQYKLVLLVMLSVLVILMALVIFSARKFSATKNVATRSYAVARHQTFGWLALGLTTLYLVLVEGKSFFIKPILHDYIFFVHLSFAVPFYFLLWALLLKLHGLNFGSHKRIGYICSLFFAFTAMTGFHLILR